MNASTLGSLYMSQNHQNLTLTNCTVNSDNRIVKIPLTTGLGNNPVVIIDMLFLQQPYPSSSKPSLMYRNEDEGRASVPKKSSAVLVVLQRGSKGRGGCGGWIRDDYQAKAGGFIRLRK